MQPIDHKPIFLSIIIPVYNESERVTNLSRVIEFLQKVAFTTELIVVNDGSDDDTLRSLRRFKQQFPFRVISYPTNRGKGYALRRGMRHARGQWQLFMDIDLSVPLTTIKHLVSKLQRNVAPIVIGSRKMRRSNVLHRQPKMRELLGEIFTKISRYWLNTPVSDFTCGFKCFTAPVARKLFRLSQLNRWGLDSELLFLATKHDFAILELPVKWRNDTRTKVKFPQDIFHSIKELWLIRWIDWQGKYR